MAMHKWKWPLALMGLLASPAVLAQPLPSDAALRERYALPASQLVEIDGEPIHYVDEGRGPTILLLHGSFGSLRQWNQWAKVLKTHYRVVRFDLPPAGLSGPSPTADYTLERKIAIIDALRERLHLGRFLLVSTSSSGIVGAAYAAQHNDRLTGLIYSNAPVGKFVMDSASFPDALKQAVAEDATHKGYHKEEYWRQIILHNVEDKSKVTPNLVREWTDLNNRYLLMPPMSAASRAASHERTPDDLPKISVPTLFLWGAQDHEASVDRDAQRGMALLGTKDKQLVVIPHCGHMLAIDCGDRALEGAMSFIRRVAKRPR
ncbi:alpha/beta fold hydrolase [Sphingobium sp. HWE2-09]|uniref:alpha/beta fold hydrolase n=1 Tax=Sphingobium sp. HWE2-09 TaxID=3108390 RepID=UPI002DCBA0E7|nr:alpha/beta hydrolase [Sphingobium sp. HWE2-09]